ncbi:hypothetical protein [Vibrio diabolicus]|uniref:hypothetical protein n=1 Tax=Vibrio diabolicus TaxID=50719 RepID=UPI003754A0A9
MHISGEFTPVQIEFIEFTLDEYIVDGVQELAVKKCVIWSNSAQYDTISDADGLLGSPAAISGTSVGF